VTTALAILLGLFGLGVGVVVGAIALAWQIGKALDKDVLP
jgi:hypothetical protein